MGWFSLVGALVVIITLGGCAGDPREEFVPPGVAAWQVNEDFIDRMKALSREERQLLTGWAERVVDVPPLVKVSEAISSEREWREARTRALEAKFEAAKADAAALTKKREAEEAARRAVEVAKQEARQEARRALMEIVEVTVIRVQKRDPARGYADPRAHTVSMLVKNKGDLAIRRFKASAELLDNLGEASPLWRVSIDTSKPIPPGGTATVSHDVHTSLNLSEPDGGWLASLADGPLALTTGQLLLEDGRQIGPSF